MTYVGTPFDKMRVTPSLDARVAEMLSGTDVLGLWGLTVSATGLTAIVHGGECMIKGRYVRVTEQEPVNVPANWTGNICITIDLTKNNDSSGNPVYDNYSVTNNQIYTRCVTDANLRSDDININGGVYDLVVAKVVSNATTLTTVDYNNVPTVLKPNAAYIRSLAVKNDRVYAKQAMFDVTVGNKYRQFALLLKRQGRMVTAQVNMKTVTTLAWEQLAELANYPGYKPDGGDYGGILNEMSYNTEPGGLYIATTSLRMMHVGRTDVKECNYSGAITYFTNDDFPPDADIVSGYKWF